MKLRTVLGGLACFLAGALFATWLGLGGRAEPPKRETAAPPKSESASPSRRTARREVRPRADARDDAAAPAGPPASLVAASGGSSAADDVWASTRRQAVDDDLSPLAATQRAPRADKAVTARFLLAGRPVAGVEINGARSDAEGGLAFSLPRNYRGFVIATQPDGVQLNLTPAQDDAEAFDFGDVRIQPAGTISGVVVDADGRPVPRADLALLSSDLDARTLSTAKSDAEGRFTIPRVGPYRYEVSARAAPPAGVAAEAFGARAAGVQAGAELRLVARAMFPVTLRLLDDATGQPTTGDWLSFRFRRPGAPWDVTFHELRHREAEVRVFLDAPGDYEIDASCGTAAGWKFRRLPVVELSAERANVVDVRLVLIEPR